MATRLFLVRHGATTLSAEDRFAGSTDVALSEEGARMQAAGIDPLRQIDEEEEAARSEAQAAWSAAQAENEGPA